MRARRAIVAPLDQRAPHPRPRRAARSPSSDAEIAARISPPCRRNIVAEDDRRLRTGLRASARSRRSDPPDGGGARPARTRQTRPPQDRLASGPRAGRPRQWSKARPAQHPRRPASTALSDLHRRPAGRASRDPQFHAFKQRLLTAGKTQKQAIVATARKEVERYQGFVILRLCREDWGTGCLGMISLASSIDGVPTAIQAT